MGSLFVPPAQVERKSDGKIYALKRVNISKMSKREVQDAVNEIRVLASVRHPHIVSFLQVKDPPRLFSAPNNAHAHTHTQASGAPSQQKKGQVAVSHDLGHWFKFGPFSPKRPKRA